MTLSVQPHTPGPWTFGYSLETYEEGADVIAWGKGMVCTMPSIEELHVLRRSVAESEANARLIAAAPDLLAALLAIAYEPCDHGPGFCPREVARAAIAKGEKGDMT